MKKIISKQLLLLFLIMINFFLLVIKGSGQQMSNPLAQPADYLSYIEEHDIYWRTQIELFGLDELLEEESGGLNQYLNWRSFWLPRLVNVGGDMSKYESNLDYLFLNQLPVLQGSGPWTEMGPIQKPAEGLAVIGGGENGIGPVNFVSLSPNYSNSGLMFTGGWRCGLFYRDNGDPIWKQAGTDQLGPAISASDCKASHLNEDVWFLSDGNGDGYFSNGPMSGSVRSKYVYRTKDRGETWEVICDALEDLNGSIWDFQIKRILIDPKSNEENLVVYITTSNGVYRTVNAMDSAEDVQWELVVGQSEAELSELPGNWYQSHFWAYDMIFIPDVQNSSCTGCGKFAVTVSKLYLENNSVKEGDPCNLQNSFGYNGIADLDILISTGENSLERGAVENWEQLDLGSELDDYYRGGLSYSPNDPNAFYIFATRCSAEGVRIYRYDLSNNIPQALGTPTPWGGYGSMMSGDAFAVSPNNADNMYVINSTRAAVSNDGGETFSNIGDSQGNKFHADVEDIEYTPNGAKVYLATHGGIYSYTFANSQWQAELDGLGVGEILGFANQNFEDQKMNIGLNHQGSMTAKNYLLGLEPAMNWKQVYGSDGNHTLVPNSSSSVSYLGTQWVYRLQNNDDFSGSMSSLSFPGAGSSEGIMELNYFDDRIIYIEQGDIYRHDNRGSSVASEWTRISDVASLVEYIVIDTLPGQLAYKIWPSAAHKDLLFAVFMNSNLFQASVAVCNKANSEAATAQNSWVVIPLPEDYLHQNGNWFGAIHSDPDDPNVFYFATNLSSEYSNVPNKLLKYTYLGDIINDDLANVSSSSWEIQDLSFNFPNINVNDLYINSGTEDVYVATDMGVYYSSQKLIEQGLQGEISDVWFMYGDNLPHCVINDIDVNFSRNQLRVGTYGRGVWQAPMLCDKLEEPKEITEATVWDAPVYRMHQDVIIQPGAELRISSKYVYFAQECGIVVRPGGRLIVDGGHLTNACPGNFWQGIVLEGNPNLTQYPESNQGVCELKNGAIIENAHTGVHVAGLVMVNNECETDPSKAGGILKASDAKFKNCYVGAEFFPYTTFTTSGSPRSNKSYFTRCEFITDKILDNSTLVYQPEPKAGIIFNEIYRIKVNGCSFKNAAVGNPDYIGYYNSQYKRGDGIIANSAVFMVASSTVPNSGGTVLPSKFENLEHGIKSLCGDYVKPFSCQNAIFTNNFCGIRTEGTYLGPVIRNNTFYVNPIADNSDGEEVSGIDVDNTTKFTIEQNTFLGSAVSNPQTTIGIAFNNTSLYCDGEHYPITQGHNLVYRNKLDVLDIGIQAEGMNALSDNQNPSENYGLEFRCNKFGQSSQPCLTDFNLLSGATVQNIQGANDDGQEAGNIFDNNLCDNPTEHFNVDGNSNGLERYYHNSNTGNLVLAPFCHNLNPNVPVETPYDYEELKTCPTYIAKEPLHLLQKNVLASNDYNDTHNLYYDRIDKGDFNLLASLVDDPTSESITIRNELIQCTPFISDEIWKRVIYRNLPMNPWHLAQALLANSPLKLSVMQMVKDSDLSEYYKTLVQNGQTGGITSRDIYESDLMLLNREVQESKREYINYYLLDEDDDEADRLGKISVMLDPNEQTDKLIMAGLSMWRGDFSETTNLLNGCITLGGREDYLCQVLSAVLQEKLSGTQNLSPATLSVLRGIATDESACGYSQARAWLSQYADEDFPQNIGSNKGSVKSVVDSDIKEMGASILSAQPNPSRGTVYLTYQLPEGIQSCEIEILDSNGKLIEKRLAIGEGIEEWNCKECSTGIYLIRLLSEGIELSTTKVSILK